MPCLTIDTGSAALAAPQHDAGEAADDYSPAREKRTLGLRRTLHNRLTALSDGVEAVDGSLMRVSRDGILRQDYLSEA